MKKSLSKNKNLIILFFILGFSVGLLFATVFHKFFPIFNSPPSAIQSEFVKLCFDLNTQEIKSENIQKLDGFCLQNNQLSKCDKENINILSDNEQALFNIYQQKTKNNTWICAVSRTESNKIKAWVYYKYE